MQKYVTRGASVGQCNICGANGKLTEDHTPPKGAIRLSQVEMRHLGEVLSAEKPQSRGRISQNGVKFRTLCARCDNEFLGGQYDPAFIDFSRAVGSYLKSTVSLPPLVHFRGKPQKIVRSLLGHLSAQGVNRYMKGPHTEDIREYFLDSSKPIPDYLDIYYWLYPYQLQILVRDVVLRNLRVETQAYIWIMKFFPLAFLVVWDNPKGYQYPQFTNLAHWRGLGIDDEVDLPIQLAPIPHERWPEAPEEHTFLLYGEGAMGAVPVARRPKR